MSGADALLSEMLTVCGAREESPLEKNYPEYYDHLCGLMRQLGSALPGPMAGFTHLHHYWQPPDDHDVSADEAHTGCPARPMLGEALGILLHSV